MKLSYILSAIPITLWGLLALLGHSMLESIEAQRALGYPNIEQVRFLLYFPMGFVLACAVACAASYFRLLRIPAYIVYALALLALLPYVLAYSGGV